MRHEQAANLARALANAVRPERKTPQFRFWRWLVRRRLADDERARSNLAHELTQLVEVLVIPDEWMPEPVGRRILEMVLKGLWLTESPGLRKFVREIRATVIVDDSVAGQGFLANIGIGGETVRIQNRYRSRADAERAAYAWVERIGAMPSMSGRTRSVERVRDDVTRDIVAPPEIAPDPTRPSGPTGTTERPAGGPVRSEDFATFTDADPRDLRDGG